MFVREVEGRWAVRVGPAFAGVNYHFVAPATRSDGSEVVLKLGLPTPEFGWEAEALRLYAGHGAVELLEEDRPQGAMLLERLRPGGSLAEVEDDRQAIHTASSVMRELWRPLPPEHTFPSITDWAAGLQKLRSQFEGGTGPLPADLVDRAEGIYRELTSSLGPIVLLHGDLHLDNILQARRRPWIAIDPQGVAGEAEYEVGALLRNPPEGMPRRRALARRLDQLAEELGFSRERLRLWGLAQAVLSAWWSVEDHGSMWDDAIECAKALSPP